MLLVRKIFRDTFPVRFCKISTFRVEIEFSPVLLYIDVDGKSNISVTVLGEIDAVYPVLDQNYY